MDNVLLLQCKIKQFLDKLTAAQGQVEVGEHFNKFLHLVKSQNTEELTAITLPAFSEWIVHMVATWSSKKLLIPSKTASFVLNLTGILTCKEEAFCALNNNNFFIKLVNILRARSSKTEPCVKLTYINLLLSFLEHKSGTEWMMASCFWEDVLKIKIQDGTLIEKTEIFLSDLLIRTIDLDTKFCDGVVKRIMQLLDENIYTFFRASANLSEIPEDMFSQNLQPALKLVGNVLEILLKETLHCQKSFDVLFLFLKNFYLEKRVSDLFFIARSKNLAFDLAKITFIMQFLELYAKKCNQQLSAADLKIEINKIVDNFTLNISKGSFEDVQRFCDFGQLYSHLILKTFNLTPLDNEEKIKYFATELLLIETTPNFCMLIQMYPSVELLLESEEIRYAFSQKIFDLSSKPFQRLFYFWRDKLIATSDLFDYSITALNYIQKSRIYFSRDEAVVTVQILIYTIKDTIFSNEDFSERKCIYFSLIFKVLGLLIQEFEITWRDGFETIHVLDATFNILALSNTWSVDVVVYALNLINVSIAKYMTPNLALLVDRTSDSTLGLLGPFLFSKLHNSNNKIREAALGIVSTMARLSCSEFPSLQEIIIESHLPTLAAEMTISDKESFVRIAAVKSLQTMATVDEIWNNLLLRKDFLQKITNLLLTEAEASNRIEIAKLLCIGYDYQRFPKEILNKLLGTMTHLAIKDSNWEVRVQALLFWDRIIKNKLYKQGMIDGKFPEVTFSQKYKKIVILTDLEIQKRLKMVLVELSENGCLHVVASAIKDDLDVDVSKTSINIIQNLMHLCKVYNVQKLIIHKKNTAIHDANFFLQDNTIITPNEFLEFSQQNLDEIVRLKKNSFKKMNDLSNFLNNVVKLYNCNDKSMEF